MKLEEAIIFLLANSGHGMKTEQIALEINERGLFQRWDKAPVSEKQIWAVELSHPEMFCKSDGRIRMLTQTISTYNMKSYTFEVDFGYGPKASYSAVFSLNLD